MESFCENNTFNLASRITGAGLSNIVARTLVIFSPMVSELPSPYPELILCLVIFIAMIVAFFLPDREEED